MGGKLFWFFRKVKSGKAGSIVCVWLLGVPWSVVLNLWGPEIGSLGYSIILDFESRGGVLWRNVRSY